MLGVALCCQHSAFAQLPLRHVSQLSTPRIRIVGSIDESQSTTLRGNRYPLATAANDRGAVSPDQPLRRMLMLLQSSPEQGKCLV